MDDLSALNVNEFKALSPVIEKLRDQVRRLLDNHLKKIPHTPDRKEMELPLFQGVLNLIGKKWSVEILWELEIHGDLYFNQLSRHLDGVTPKALSDTLKQLEEDKMVNREISQLERPPKVYYSLTDKGKGFVELSMLIIWFLFTHKNAE